MQSRKYRLSEELKRFYIDENSRRRIRCLPSEDPLVTIESSITESGNLIFLRGRMYNCEKEMRFEIKNGESGFEFSYIQ